MREASRGGGTVNDAWKKTDRKMEGKGVVAVRVRGLNSVSHHLRSASPSCPPPLGSLGT